MSDDNEDVEAFEHVNPCSYAEAQNDDGYQQPIRLPDYLGSLVGTISVVINSIWENPKIDIHRKLDALDEIRDKMPPDVRKKYRNWRFSIRKGKRPEFIENEFGPIKQILGILFNESVDLDQFSKWATRVSPVLHNQNGFLSWLNDEGLELEPSIDQMLKDYHRAISLHLQYRNPDPEGEKPNFALSIDLIQSKFTELFANLCSGENEYGLNKTSICLTNNMFLYEPSMANIRCTLLLSKNVGEYLQLLEDHQDTVIKSTVFEVGDVLVSCSATQPFRCRIAIMTVKVSLEDDFIRIGRVRNGLPNDLAHLLNETRNAVELKILVSGPIDPL